MSKTPSQFLRLKDNHHNFQKMCQLVELAEELEIQISFYSHSCVVTIGDQEYLLIDIEKRDHVVSEFPYSTEWALLKTNPEYSKYQEEQEKRRQAEVAGAKRKTDEAEKMKRERVRLIEERRKEERERQEYLRLKEKFDP